MINSSSSDAAQRVRRYISHHGLKPGDQLPTHEELSKRLRVGRGRLREGLSILRHQGLLETRNKRGTIVRRPTITTLHEPLRWHLDGTGYKLEDLISARAWLESGVAAEAAERRTARDLLKILDALEQLETMIEVERSDWPEDEAFHLAIMEATHNPIMLTFGQLVRMNLEEQQTAKPPSASWRREFNKHHRAIYEAIERRNMIAARDSMYAHIRAQVGHHETWEEDG